MTTQKPTSPSSQNAPQQTMLRAIEATTEENKTHLKLYSNSRLVAHNQCPVWGTISSQRRYESDARAMALEAGATMHEVFSVIRLWQLSVMQELPKHAQITGQRLFGQERWKQLWSTVRPDLDPREALIALAFETLQTSGFYDDPRDNVRTITNMELAAIRYIDERLGWMEQWPIYVSHTKGRPDPATKALVGIEQVFDVTLHYVDNLAIRYIGTIDGLTYSHHYKRHFLDENKTASRLDEGWRRSFELSHQVTGYCAASTTVFGFPVFDAHIFGVKIKPGGRMDDLYTFMVKRTGNAIHHWANWVRYTVTQLAEPYQEDFESAPRFTHSCNRYFRPCSLIPFCGDTPEGRQEQFAQMVPIDPSPSERAIMEQF